MADDTLARLFWERVERAATGPPSGSSRAAPGTRSPGARSATIVREVALGLIALGRREGRRGRLLSASRAEWVQADFAIFSRGLQSRSRSIRATRRTSSSTSSTTRGREDPLRRGRRRSSPRCSRCSGRWTALEQIVVMQGYQGRSRRRRCMTWDGAAAARARQRRRRTRATLAERVAAITAGGHRDDRVHVGHHRAAEGRRADARQPPRARSTVRGQGRRQCEDGGVHLLFLPLAHSFARLESFLGVHRGLTTAFAENIDKLRDNLPEVQPHFICSVPRVFEKVYAGVLAKAEAGLAGQAEDLPLGASAVGREVSAASSRRGQPVPAGLARQARDRPQARVLASSTRPSAGGCASRSRAARRCPREIAEFFHAAGILHPRGLRAHRDLPVAHLQPARARSSSARWGRRCRASRSRSRADGEILGRGRQHRARATSRSRRRPRRSSSRTAGSTPATSGGSTRTGSSSSPTARRTSS